MIILKSSLLKQFPEITFGFSTKIGLNRKPPYNFNLSLSVGDNSKIVLESRKCFYEKLGLTENNVALQKQVHGDKITLAENGGIIGESDAMITNVKNLGLAVSTADCTPVFVYDTQNKIIAGIHAGWRGTEKKIVEKTIIKMKDDYNSDPENIFVYIGPSISQKNYEVGKDFEEKFDSKYLNPLENEKLLLDVKKANLDQLLENGIPSKNIQLSELCSYEFPNLLHSYRREGEKSGRSLGIIAIRK